MADHDSQQQNATDTSTSRLQLIWDVLVFQLKLAADGPRDVLLSPISIISAIMGLVAGGHEPDRYFKQVLKLGRRTEIWLNLFGYRKHAGTSDELLAPFKEKFFSQAQQNPWMSKAGSGLNKRLDSVNASISAKKARIASASAGAPASADTDADHPPTESAKPAADRDS